MYDLLQQLLDKDAVIHTLNRLFISTDNRDWAAVASCFAPEVQFDMTSLASGEPSTLTPQQIVAAWEQGLSHLEAVHHQAGNYVVSVDGETAEAFCYGTASHYLPNESGENTRTFVGSYDFHLVKEDEGWRIAAFKFNLKYLEGNANLEARPE